MSITPEHKIGPWTIPTNHHGRQPVIRDNGSVEYEPTITIDGVEIPESQRSAYLKKREEMRAKSEAERRRAEMRTLSNNTGRTCPFKISRNTANTACTKDCPFYTGSACVLSGKHPAPAAEGTFCPICGSCRPSCAVYKAGCTMPDAIKRITEDYRND